MPTVCVALVIYLVRLWPKAEITDAEVQAHLSSALERKAAISQPEVFTSASDPSRNLRLSVKVVKCLHILTWWFAIRM
jgi:hypothetical protein